MKINSLHCPVTNALTVLGGKWKINIIFLLSNKTMRFGAIKNTLQGITQQMLSKQLKELERDKLIIRTCLLYTSPSPRDATLSRMPSSA